MDLTVHVKFNQNIAKHVKTPTGEPQVKLLRNLKQFKRKRGKCILDKTHQIFTERTHLYRDGSPLQPRRVVTASMNRTLTSLKLDWSTRIYELNIVAISTAPWSGFSRFIQETSRDL